MKKNDEKTFYWMLLLFVSFAFFALLVYQLETDYFWHIKAGEYMVHHGLLKQDVFSWFVAGRYWMSHEWLFEVFLYGLKSVFGTIHVYVYLFPCILFLYLFIFLVNRKGFMKNIPYGLVFLLLFALIYMHFIQARPHMISFCFLAVTFYCLYDLYKNEDSKKIYFLPFLSVLWANVHGGSSNLPYLLCFIFLLGGIFQFQFKKIEATRFSKKQFIKYFVVMLLCMVAVCINLHGFKMFLYPYENMANATMLSNIGEWQVTSLNDKGHYLYYAMVLFVVGTFLFSSKKIQLIDFLFFGFVTYLGLKSIRFWVFTPIIMSFIVFDYVKARKIDRGTNLGLAIMGILLLTCFAWSWNDFGKIKYELSLSEDLVTLIKKEKPERLYNMYDFGGELIYHDIPVFIDGRADLYSPYNYQDYLDISKLREDYVSLIQKYDFDYFVVRTDFPIYMYLKYSDEYEEIYFDENAALYKKIVN